MFKSILSASLMVALLGLTGCEEKKAPAPKPAAVAQKSPEQIAAEKQKAAAAEVSAVMETLKKKHPDTINVIYAVNRVNVGASMLFEVVTSESVFYTDKDVNYILVGSLFTGEDKKVVNLTARPQVQEQLQKAREKALADNEKNSVGGFDFFNSLPLKNGFVYTYGTGANRIAVFEDPDCPFCQQLHKNLEEFGGDLNVQVTVFPFVMESLHPNALARVKNFFCAPDPAKAWKNWMLTAAAARAKGDNDMDKLWSGWSAQNAPKNDCPQAVLAETWQSAGRQLGYTATPTVVFENGATVEGNVDRAAFEQMFADVAAQKSAAPATVSPEQIQQAQQDAADALKP